MTFGFLIFPEVEELDFVGPWEIVGTWGKFYGGPDTRVTIAETAGPIECANGLSVNPHVTFESCPALDYLLVPGGRGSRREVDNPAFIDFIRKHAAGCRAVLSVCTGSFLLERAGVLENKRATTHWGELPKLRKLKNLDVVEERFVRTGNVWVGAGVSAGTDLALAFIASEAGEDVASQVQFFAEYYPSPKRYGRAHRDEQAPAYVKAEEKVAG
jgi:transcriptional regulator GlxA family with amidase domain